VSAGPFAKRRFASKADAREAVWTHLAEARLARFPFPPTGRIPNFAGAREAAERLLDHPAFRDARRLKVNPDAPQLPLRALALGRGIEVLMPTPRLRGGFKLLDPKRIPEKHRRKAASLSGCDAWAEVVALGDMPEVDAIVCGSVAVTRGGARCGKGEGYSDLEYAILRELGHPPVPVGTTVHDAQVVGGVPTEATDLPLAAIATPTERIDVPRPRKGPRGIVASRLTEEDLAAMPILRELLARRG